MTNPTEMMTFLGNTTAGEEQATSRVSILNLSRLFGTTILFFYAWLIISASILFISGRGISVTNTLLAFGLTTVYFIWVSRNTFRFNWKLILTGFAIITLLSCLSYAISSRFFDLSWDGRDYNQKAIRALSSGWDPVYNEQQPTDIYYNTWLNHYPKGAWIASASLYQLTGNIEGAKVFNLLLIAAVFFMALAFCLRFPQLKTWQAVLISLMLAANPVSIYQSLSFYVDGQVASILALLLLTFLLAFIQSDDISLVSIFAILLIGLNLKFTATAYIVLLTIGLLAAGFYLEKRALANIPGIQHLSANGLLGNSQTPSTKSRQFRRLLAVTIAGVFLGVLVAGFNPYVTNLIYYRNPFFPVWGDSVYNQEYIVGSQMPSNFEGKNRFQKL
ncbi:MAG: hypothetical protein ACM3PY_19905, partial [Omnitrophica WOR_2 bacterium]